MMAFMREGGPMMWLILLLAIPTLAMAIMHAVFAQKWSTAAAVAPLLLVLAVAALANLHAKSKVAAAMRMMELDPSQRATIERVGDAEAARPWQLALGVAVLCIIPIGVGEARRLARR